MKAIWKYPLSQISSRTKLEMPKGAKVLTAREQENLICIWAEVDTAEPEVESRIFYAVPTGATPLSCSVTYIGTSMRFNGALVDHVYEHDLNCDCKREQAG